MIMIIIVKISHLFCLWQKINYMPHVIHVVFMTMVILHAYMLNFT